ncbi:MAG: DUF6512 family protein [Bacilli bacterium]
MLKKIKKDIIISIIPIFILGTLFHFLFDISNNDILIGLISPVNESVWEHLKLLFIPTILWYLIYSKFNSIINKDKWFSALIISLFSSMISVIVLYYTYMGIFNIELVIVDILIFLISIIIGQLLGYYYYKNASFVFDYKVSFLILLIIFFVFTIFTFNPPKIPLFYDYTTNSYGIKLSR